VLQPDREPQVLLVRLQLLNGARQLVRVAPCGGLVDGLLSGRSDTPEGLRVWHVTRDADLTLTRVPVALRLAQLTVGMREARGLVGSSAQLIRTFRELLLRHSFPWRDQWDVPGQAVLNMPPGFLLRVPPRRERSESIKQPSPLQPITVHECFLYGSRSLLSRVAGISVLMPSMT
jgi:hypothetical protein